MINIGETEEEDRAQFCRENPSISLVEGLVIQFVDAMARSDSGKQ